jgi:hypothetical protein
LRKFKVKGDTNAKPYVRLTFGIYVLYRPTKLGDGIALAYTYLNPVLQVLAAWPNQTLTDSNGTDHAIEVCLTDGGVTRWPQAATGHLALIATVRVMYLAVMRSGPLYAARLCRSHERRPSQPVRR